ncbi:hypothetical protein ACHAWF_007278 [Thalassiosira exigua]
MCTMNHQSQGSHGSGAGMSFVPVHLAAFQAVPQKQKQVRFQPTITVQPLDCRLTQGEKFRSFYSKDELDSFSLEARLIQAASKELYAPACAVTCGAHATTQACAAGLEADPSLRGLELYLCPIRVRNKAIVKRALLKYHKKLDADPKTSEEKLLNLASASAKLSQWSKQVALETARLDSLRACDDEYPVPINEPVDITPFPATVRRRRRVTQEGKDHQPVKRRRFDL